MENSISKKTIIGISEKYSSPEIDEMFDAKIGKNYNPFISDVFSLGITMLKLINYRFEKVD